MKTCTGPCQQGRQACPTPEACELEAEEPDFYGRAHWLDLVCDAALAGALAGAVILAGVLITGCLS